VSIGTQGHHERKTLVTALTEYALAVQIECEADVAQLHRIRRAHMVAMSTSANFLALLHSNELRPKNACEMTIAGRLVVAYRLNIADT
jgi:hypothetical protein